MVKLNKIYTRTGDEGETGLVGGGRIRKNHPRVEAYGDVDEANAIIGLVRLHTSAEPDAMLERIQHDLFDLGADLATPFSHTEAPESALRMLPTQTERLERDIDMLNEKISPLHSFILPGGTPASSYLHLARTIVRRAERMAFALAEHEPVNPHALHYLNRLSDFLFVLARAMNDNGTKDVLWKPGVNR